MTSKQRTSASLENGYLPSWDSESTLASANNAERRKWKGFCEIESEPAFFNAMLTRFGVEGVKVQEVVSLDEEMLAIIPRPVYGLIFLFRWMEEDPQKQEQSCPKDVWFANQTSNNACASVALLNIVNNIPGIELGKNLDEFKHFTADFSPTLRGDAISNFEFVKDIHNSFARKLDMLNADLLLKDEATSKDKSRKTQFKDEEYIPGFHFIAFMPIQESLWKFDGLERQPVCLGPVISDWLSQATPDIQDRMAQYEESQIEFAVMSLVKDPLIDLLSDLAKNVNSLIATQSRLDEVQADWTIFTADDADDIFKQQELGVLKGPDAALGLSEEHLSKDLTTRTEGRQVPLQSATAAIERRKELITTQQDLKLAIQEEMQSKHSEQERASARTRDFGAKMQKFTRKVLAMKVT